LDPYFENNTGVILAIEQICGLPAGAFDEKASRHDIVDENRDISAIYSWKRGNLKINIVSGREINKNVEREKMKHVHGQG
jgi:hypothetical protein